MFRLFRHFVVLFLGINLIPMAALLLWDQHHFKQMMSHRLHAAQSLTTGSLRNFYSSYLLHETTHFVNIVKAFPASSLSLVQYKSLLGTEDIWWVDDGHITGLGGPAPKEVQQIVARSHLEPVTDFMTIHPQAHRPAQLATFSYMPIQNGQHQGVLVVKPVPLDRLLPNGPFEFHFYSGDKVDASHFMASLHDPFMQMMKNQRKRFPCGPRPCPDKRPPMRPMQKLSIRNKLNQPVATILIQEFHPPGPPGFEQSRWFGLIILLTSVTSSAFIGLYLKKNFIGPLLRLSWVSQKVQGGDWKARVETDNIKQPDVRATVDNFNRMVEELSEKDALRKNFITNLTHDLRTPLIAQERTLSLLAKEFEDLNLKEQAGLASGLARNNQHLLGMINQLLETYKFEDGEVQLALKPTFLPDLIQHCFEQLGTLAHESEITLNSHFPEAFAEIEADVDYLKRVFINLLGNAIENIPNGSTIAVSGEVHGDQVEIHVRDNGPGINRVDLENIFNRYYVGGETQKIGSGLGLYICKMFVEAHQGTISVDSALGEYTDFRIRLPRNPKTKE